MLFRSERWSLQEREVARDRRSHPVSDMTNVSTITTRLSDSSITQFPHMFPRLNPFRDDDSEPLLPPVSASSSSMLTTRNTVTRKRLVCLLEEALDISNSIVLDNKRNDTDKERLFQQK